MKTNIDETQTDKNIKKKEKCFNIKRENTGRGGKI